MQNFLIDKIKANAKKIEIVLLVISIIFVLSITMPLLSRYKVKKEQRTAIIEAIDYMRAFRTAYAQGEKSIDFNKKEFKLVEGTTFETQKFRAIDHTTECVIKLKTQFVEGVPLFIFNEILPDCWGYIRESSQLREFTRLSLDSKLEN